MKCRCIGLKLLPSGRVVDFGIVAAQSLVTAVTDMGHKKDCKVGICGVGTRNKDGSDDFEDEFNRMLIILQNSTL